MINGHHPKDKRHASVEPHASTANKNVVLIPNGMNNGRMFRRQSSDTQNVAQNIVIDHPGSIQNKNEKANAWVRRMRFVMAQAT